MRLFGEHLGKLPGWLPKGSEWEPIRGSWNRLRPLLGLSGSHNFGSAKAFREACRLKWPCRVATKFAALPGDTLARQAFDLQLPDAAVKAVLTACEPGAATLTPILPPGTWLYGWSAQGPPKVWVASSNLEVVQSPLPP